MEELKKQRQTAYRRQLQIENCLYQSLLQRPYPSVSISDMCHQLDISRKAFYNYYPDKDTCFRSILNRRLEECALLVSETAGDNDTQEQIIAAYLNYWKSQRPLLDIIVRNNLLTMLMDQCILFLQKEDTGVLDKLNTPQLKTNAYVLASFVCVHITFMLQWYLGNFETPMEEMIQHYQRLVFHPLVNPVEIKE